MKTNANNMRLLQKEIEVTRKQLDELLVQKSHETLDDEVIHMSQMLDKLLLVYMRNSIKNGYNVNMDT